jgi:hypothetical protein
MKHKKISLIAQKIGQTFSGIQKKKKKFQWFRSYTLFNEALQSRFFAKKMT